MNSFPDNPNAGQMFFDVVDGSTHVFDGQQWVLFAAYPANWSFTVPSTTGPPSNWSASSNFNTWSGQNVYTAAPQPITGMVGPYTVANPYPVSGMSAEPCDTFVPTTMFGEETKLCDTCGWHEGTHAPAVTDEDLAEMQIELLKLSARLKD